MSARLCSALLLAICLGLAGCWPAAQSQMDEQKNPHFLAGKEKLGALDYNGAIACFERALEDNPRSALAHYELGVLFDQHEIDYADAIYHYNKALKLRPRGYPADNIRQRIPACRQELIKADSLAVINPSVLRETERLREENQSLRQQIEILQARLAGRPPMGAGSGLASGSAESPRAASSPTNSLAFYGADGGGGNRGTASAPADRTLGSVAAGSRMRTHSVKAGDTLIGVARFYQIKLSSLQAANPGLDPKRVRVGSILNIPAS